MVLATRIVAPVSAWTSGTSSSRWASHTSAKRASRAQRSAIGVRDHESNAARAASQASPAWAGEASGATPTTCSVDGLMTS